MKSPEAAVCSGCQHYDEGRAICRKDQRVRHPRDFCGNFRIKLADHYIPNPWDAWKKQAEQKAAGEKVKSGQ